jgi:hypothetical protein
MACLCSDPEKESDDCHYVVTLPTQIFLDATFAEIASRRTSFVGIGRGRFTPKESCSSVFLCTDPLVDACTVTYGNATAEEIESGPTC